MNRKSVRINPSEIAKRVTLSHDGKQLTMRIPRKISQYMGLEKGDNLVMSIDTKEEVENKRHHIITLRLEDVYEEEDKA